MSKIAVITGSSGGIGSALVQLYLQDNYVVIGLDLCSSVNTDLDNFIELNLNLREFAKKESYREKILNQIKNLLPEKFEKFVLINNAAEQIIKNVADINGHDWDNSLAVNTVAPFFLTQGLLEILIASRGHVINMSSIHSKLTKAKFSCYAASKSALESITRSLAIELSQKGVSVNAIAPAAISTEMLKHGFANEPHKLTELESYHPSGTIGSPEQLASFVKSVTDQKGGFLTGSVLEFNGGIGGVLYDPN
ncbi:SDR family oxidoreductase [Gammaproteobacteria bacterium]|nr:SDR family oxidoreductase [Gammaproteobacteria bacterium]